MRFQQILAVQKLRTLLLITALVSVFLTGILVVDLVRSLRTVIISDTTRLLVSAAEELIHTAEPWRRGHRERPFEWAREDEFLRNTSYEVLRSYPEVEGGYLWHQDLIGHSFPTHTEPGSALLQPPEENREVLDALAESRATGRVATRIAHYQGDLILVAVLADADSDLAAWSLRRIFNFSDTSELNKRLLLVVMTLVSLLAIGAVLRLSYSLQRGFGTIQEGLDRLRTDVHYRLPDNNRELSAIVKSINGMAESRQQLEAELRREDRLRVIGRVVAGIAHEIRNPLNSLRLTVRVLARNLQQAPAAQQSVQVITAEIDRLDALLKSLLFFRADEPPRLRRLPMQPLLERSVAIVRPHAEERGVAIQIEPAGDKEVFADHDYLQQALMNLMLNAIDATGPGGSVRLGVEEHDGLLEISVQDSGDGLTPEQYERIFEAFYTTKQDGTGLGLAITKTLIEKMGGMITCKNTSQGACFRLLLPAGGAYEVAHTGD